MIHQAPTKQQDDVRRADALHSMTWQLTDMRQLAKTRKFIGARQIATQMWRDLESFDPFSQWGRRGRIVNLLREMFCGVDHQIDTLLIGIIDAAVRDEVREVTK